MLDRHFRAARWRAMALASATAMVCVVAGVAAVPAGAEGGGGPRPSTAAAPGGGADPGALADYVANHPASASSVGRFRAAHAAAASAGPDGASDAAKACYGTGHTHPTGQAPQLDVAAFGLMYDCTFHIWNLDLTTADNWDASQLSRVIVYVDDDLNASTGCMGYDRAVIGTYDATNGLSAATLITPSCDPSTFRVASNDGLDHPQPNTLIMGFSNEDLGNPASFRWHGLLQGTSESTADLFPVSGDLTEQGYPPVPADNPCPPGSVDGMTARVAVVSNPARTTDAASALEAGGLGSVRALPGGVLQFTGDPRRAVDALAGAGLEGSVSTDRVARYQDVPDNPQYPQQWNLAAIDMPTAWGFTHGSPAIAVADLDSGVDATHPQLQGKLLPGYDARTGTALAGGNTDTVGHGTEVAGVIAATTNTGMGIAAVGWDTKVVPIKLSDQPKTSEIVGGIMWATDHGLRILNLSLGTCGDPTLAAAVQYAEVHGALVVAAAGNQYDDGNPVQFPAGYPGVVAVGATGRDGTRAGYSETGPNIGLVAPGGSADSNPDDDLILLQAGGGYTTGAGTSFASPEVAAVAALVLAADPSLTPTDAGALMEATARQTQTSPDAAYGHGLLEAGTTLQAATKLTRAAGGDRFGTAVALSQLGFPGGASTAYVASGRTFADALPTGALSGVQPGPVLLTDTCALPASAAAELARLKPQSVYVIGGPAAVCDGVLQAITQQTGVTPTRVAGADRYATDAAIVALGWPGQVQTAYVTTGVNFPDGLTGSARAAKDGSPLLLADTCALPQPVHDQLVRLAPKVVKIIGGSAALCPDIDRSISSVTGAQVVRISGANRVQTGIAVVADGWANASTVLVASAANFPDALSAGALAAQQKEPLLLNDACGIDQPVAAELQTLAATKLIVAGGSNALCGAAVAPLVAVLG